jgi:hypothetical protein
MMLMMMMITRVSSSPKSDAMDEINAVKQADAPVVREQHIILYIYLFIYLLYL